jgi:hypothetical protein
MLISWFREARLRLLPGKMSLVVAVSFAAGAGLTAGGPYLAKWLGGNGSDPAPAPLIDKRFIPLGRSYLPELGKQYSAAWNEGAKALESGQSVSSALKCVSQTWDHGRVELFDRLLTPELSKIVPEGQADTETKLVDRLALARAWRGLASGLGTRRWVIGWP